jgi:hypothetical protein
LYDPNTVAAQINYVNMSITMLRRLPNPKKTVFCPYCKDVTPIAADRHSDYCKDCQRTIKPRPGDSSGVK